MSPHRQKLLTLAFAVCFMALFSLGTWQVQRLGWKRDLIADVTARRDLPPSPLAEGLGVPYLPVQFQATFEPAPALHIAGSHDGTPGYFVFTVVTLPESLAGASRLVINRGFVPSDARRADGLYPVPSATVDLRGLTRTFEGEAGLAAALAPPVDVARRLAYRRSAETFADAFGSNLAPIYVDLSVDAAPAGIKSGTTRLVFSNNHLGYAITWFGLASSLAISYLLLLRRRRSPNDAR